MNFIRIIQSALSQDVSLGKINVRIVFCAAFTIVIFMTISQAQWVQTNGPYSGDVRALAASGSDMIGSEVAVLASEEFAAGNHSQVWDATRYPRA